MALRNKIKIEFGGASPISKGTPIAFNQKALQCDVLLGLILTSGKRRAKLISKKGSTTWIEREREKERKRVAKVRKISVLQEHGHYIKE